MSLLGMKVLEHSMMPGDAVVIVRNSEVMHRFVWTANALADQEREIERLRSDLASLRAAVEALAGEWEREQLQDIIPKHNHAAALRSLLLLPGGDASKETT